jgi:two-component system sensor histidine kinase PilS (NtrC family)
VPSSSRPAQAASAVPLGAAELHQRLVWLTLFRTVATSLCLAAFSIPMLARPSVEPSVADGMAFTVISLVFLSTLVYGVMLRRRQAGRVAAVAQVVGDAVTATALVLLTGGVESPFTFTYSLAVVGAAIVLDRRGALVAAFVSSLAYTSLLVLGHAGLLPQAVTTLSLGRALFLLVSNALALFLIAVLAGYLSGQLSTQRGQLSAREADLRRLSELHRQILARMPSGLITCDASGRVTYVNQAASSILALPEGPVRLGAVESLLPGVMRLGGEQRRRELSVHTPTGERILGLSVTTLEGEQGSLLIVFQDLTELRHIEEGLRRSDRLAAVGTLAAQLAHEIRNPLAAMRGAAQLLAQDPGVDPASGRLTQILLRESDRLSKLVDDFLRFARPPVPDKRPVALDALVTETLEMLRVDPLSRGAWLDATVQPQQVEADADQLRQVLLNLLRNALQAAGTEGQVRVSVEGDAHEAHIRVWDSKGGIPPASLPRLFEPFFTTREGGTGLGLSTAHAIIRAHGGDIRVRSSPADGTEFDVVLPKSVEASGA